MEIVNLNLSKEQSEKIFPGRILSILDQKNTYVFGAVDEGQVECVAVLCGTERHFVIVHIDMGKNGTQEIFDMLIGHIEKVCKDAGEKVLTCRIISADEGMKEIDENLQAFMYQPFSKIGHLVYYSLADMLKSDFAAKRGKLGPLLNQVRSYDELTKRQIVELVDALKASKDNYNFEMPDLKFARFFEVQGKIAAYLNVERLAPDYLYLKDVYCENGGHTKYAFPAMLGSLLNIMEEDMPEESVIAMQIYKDNFYKGIINIYGEGNAQGIYEYYKIL